MKILAMARSERAMDHDALKGAEDRVDAMPSGEPSCPPCAGGPAARNGDRPAAVAADRCRRGGNNSRSMSAERDHRHSSGKGSAPLGGIMLIWRNGMLRLLEHVYWLITWTGSVILLLLGGFVPVVRGWLSNELDGWSGVVAALGGVWFTVQTHDPDSDLGPVLARVDCA